MHSDLCERRRPMTEKETIRRARQDKREGKAPSTQAGEFVREEIEHVREGKHGVRNTKQAIAIGLSKARRAGVELPPPPGEQAPKTTRGPKTAGHETSATRSRATLQALQREGSRGASPTALSRQART